MIDGLPAILIVDDQKTTRTLVRTSLREIGYREMIEAGDGEEALRILSERRIQLIISDLEMPKLNGIGLLRAVRASPEHKATPFILLTSRGEVAVVKEAKEIGVNGFVIKPFALGPLKQRVEAVIGPPSKG